MRDSDVGKMWLSLKIDAAPLRIHNFIHRAPEVSPQHNLRTPFPHLWKAKEPHRNQDVARLFSIQKEDQEWRAARGPAKTICALTAEPSPVILHRVCSNTTTEVEPQPRIKIDHETNLSTQPKQAEKSAWLPCSNEHSKWPKHHQAPKGEGPQEAHRLTQHPHLPRTTPARSILQRRLRPRARLAPASQFAPESLLRQDILLFTRDLRQLKNRGSGSLLARARGARQSGTGRRDRPGRPID